MDDTDDSILEEPGESLGRRIYGLHRYWRIYIDKHLEPFGIGSGQLPALLALYHNEGLNQEQLTRKLHVDKATTTRALSRLEELDLVRRERDPLDRRAFRLFLTDRGKEIRPRIRSVLADWTQMLSMGLSDRELEQAYELLGRMLANAAALDAAIKEAESGS